MTECWKPLPRFEGLYEVSDAGRIRRLARFTHDGRRWRKKLLKLWNRCKRHYVSAHICVNGERSVVWAHIAVLEAFVGPRPFGADACHNNGNRHDNRLENLRWDSRAGNFADKVKHGTHNRGERHHRAHFTDEEARRIRDMPGTIGGIAKRLGVSKTCIQKIKERKSYAVQERQQNEITVAGNA